MAWTAPLTFTPNTALTASQLNAQLRDNLLETMPGRANQEDFEGAHFAVSGTNEVTPYLPAGETIDASQTTTSTSYTDLATFGPSITLNTGTHALVILGAEFANSTTQTSYMGYTVSGASTVAATDTQAAAKMGTGFYQFSQYVYQTGLTAGSNTFTMRYRVTGGTGTFVRRRIAVMPY